MIREFIMEVKNEPIYYPDNINSSADWKEEIYGKPFNIFSKKTQNALLDSFLITSPYRVGIIFEGKTEETVIRLLLNKLNLSSQKYGFFLFNAEGQQNIIRNLLGLFYLSNLNAIEIFLIIDNDSESKILIDKFKQIGIRIKKTRIHIWKKDFEYDNFGVQPVVMYINHELKKKGLKEISIANINSKISTQKVLMAIINEEYNKNIRATSRLKLDDIISKRRMGKYLIQKRLKEIETTQNNNNEYKPKLPIEKIIYKMIFSITRTLDL